MRLQRGGGRHQKIETLELAFVSDAYDEFKANYDAETRQTVMSAARFSAAQAMSRTSKRNSLA